MISGMPGMLKYSRGIIKKGYNHEKESIAFAVSRHVARRL